jgi:dUTP pyrophosphatase
MVTINVLNIEGKGTLPIHGDGKTESFAAGYDIVAVDDPQIFGEVGSELTLEDGTKVPLYKSIQYLEYHTALKVQPKWNEYGEYHHLDMHPRSSVRKYNLILANSIGVIDNDYRGEILVSFKYIFQPEDFVIQYEELEKGFKPLNLLAGINWTKVYRKGDKIAQLIAEKTNEANYVFVSELTPTARGEGGHGSTGQQAAPPLKSEQQQHSTILDAYNKTGGVPTRKRYIDEVREREYLADQAKPKSSIPIPQKTGINERRA